MKNILVLNPGSTSTKIAVYHDNECRWSLTVRHTLDELAPFARIIDQFEYRKQCIVEALQQNHIPLDFDAIMARGGLLKPIPGGVYEVNDVMLNDIVHAMRTHACNLGCLIAHELAVSIPNCRAFIADPGVVDELEPIARLTGYPRIPRIAMWHALNQRAVAHRYAAELTTQHPDQPTAYADLDLIVCHLGGGISVGIHRHGRAVDVPNALDGTGPFSPERAGTLPAGQLIDLCFSGQVTKEELKRCLTGQGGLVAHLGTNDVRVIEQRIREGDKHAELVLNAMIYQVAKEIGAGAAVLFGRVDAILITGGMAYSEYIISRLRERIAFIGPIHIYPGEDEMEALAFNVLEALNGRQEIRVYQ